MSDGQWLVGAAATAVALVMAKGAEPGGWVALVFWALGALGVLLFVVRPVTDLLYRWEQAARAVDSAEAAGAAPGAPATRQASR